jgi:hypothetical protein
MFEPTCFAIGGYFAGIIMYPESVVWLRPKSQYEVVIFFAVSVSLVSFLLGCQRAAMSSRQPRKGKPGGKRQPDDVFDGQKITRPMRNGGRAEPAKVLHPSRKRHRARGTGEYAYNHEDGTYYWPLVI